MKPSFIRSVTVCLVIVMCGLHLSFSSAASLDERKRELMELALSRPNSPWGGRVYSLTHEEREFVIRELRNLVQWEENDKKRNVSVNEGALSALWRLGDEYGLKRYITEFKNDFGSS